MAKEMKCRDVGFDCDYVAKGDTEGDILKQVAEHATAAHPTATITPEVVEKVKSVIHDV